MAAELDDIDELADLGDLDIGDIEGVGADGEGATPPKGGLLVRKKKIITLGIVVLLAAGVGAWFFTGSELAPKVAEDTDDDDADDEVVRATPYYFSLDPAFVVNFLGRGQARFLQVNIEGLTRNSDTKSDITMHLPHIRNNIVLLLSSKTYDELITPEGKETLRKEILTEVKKILRKETGRDDIENVYFTSFVMQ